MANKKEQDLQKTTRLKSKTDPKALENSVPSGGTFFPPLLWEPKQQPWTSHTFLDY